MSDQVMQVTLKAVADVKDVITNMNAIQTAMGKLSLPKNLDSQFKSLFSNFKADATTAIETFNNGFKTNKDVKQYATQLKQVNSDILAINKLIEGSKNKGIILKTDDTNIKSFKQQIVELEQQIASIDSNKINELQKAYSNLLAATGKKSNNRFLNFQEAFKAGDLETARAQIRGLEGDLKRVGSDDIQKIYQALANAMKLMVGESPELDTLRTTLENLTTSLKTLEQEAGNRGTQGMEELGAATRTVATEGDKAAKSLEKTAQGQQQFNSELDQLKYKVSYFFGLTNAVNIFRNAIRAAYNTVKDLDAVMTETAVVTDFSVGDMWSQLPEYTKRANELGVSIHDAYEAATIYYQQGLSTNEVMAVSNETLKMARIAGLEAADATDRKYKSYAA